MKNEKKLYNKRGITFFHETERYVNNLNIYNRSKNGTNLWNDLIQIIFAYFFVNKEEIVFKQNETCILYFLSCTYLFPKV